VASERPLLHFGHSGTSFHSTIRGVLLPPLFHACHLSITCFVAFAAAIAFAAYILFCDHSYSLQPRSIPHKQQGNPRIGRREDIGQKKNLQKEGDAVRARRARFKIPRQPVTEGSRISYTTLPSTTLPHNRCRARFILSTGMG
jgi:hypothetical protein